MSEVAELAAGRSPMFEPSLVLVPGTEGAVLGAGLVLVCTDRPKHLDLERGWLTPLVERTWVVGGQDALDPGSAVFRRPDLPRSRARLRQAWRAREP